MLNSGDFKDPQTLVEEARFAYTEIYNWHTSRGTHIFDERFGKQEGFERRKSAYAALLAQLVKPGEAAIQDMLDAALQVLSGRMEWAYGEMSEQGETLSHLARRIQEILHQHGRMSARNLAAEQLKAFRNLGEDGMVIDGLSISIPILGNESWSIEEYYRYAEVAYRDVPESDNIGGRIFLIQTNLEHSRKQTDKYSFQNAHLLHVEFAGGKHSITELIRCGDLSVESVTLGE